MKTKTLIERKKEIREARAALGSMFGAGISVVVQQEVTRPDFCAFESLSRVLGLELENNLISDGIGHAEPEVH